MKRDTLKALARAALQNLEANRQRIDDLNVYPVPDGDTGTNLVLTLRRIVEAIEQSNAETKAEMADEVFHIALRAGRGNSGVIFSQIVRGFAKTIGHEEEVDAPAFARAIRAGSDAAYQAVSHVGAVEGTIITVIREMAEEAERKSGRGVSPSELMSSILARGEDALARTPEMLEILRHAGVVDAGGAGLVEIVRGITLAAHGTPIPSGPVLHEKIGTPALHQDLSRFRYCTGFILEGDRLDPVAFEAALEQLGDSLLVVGDETALKVHVHTDDPGAALSAATAMGVIDEVEIADMHAQTAAREARLARAAVLPVIATGLVAVAQGSGNRAIFEGENAIVVDGGQTTNPTVGEMVDAIEATRAGSVIVLPNNSNVLLAASEAADLTQKDVCVIPSRSIQAGRAVIRAYIATNSLAENERDMLEVLSSVATGELTVASRDVELDGVLVREGAYLGFVDGTAVACDDTFDNVANRVVDRMLDGERTHLDIIVGDGAPVVTQLVAGIRQTYPEIEVEVHEGGQPHYPLLVVAE